MEKEKRKITLLGSTGSIGTQALDVIAQHPDRFEVYAITANHQADLLIEQARTFLPEVAVIADESLYDKVKTALHDLPIKVWAGSDAICQVVESEPIDMVLTAMVGFSGLRPTIAAIKAGKTIALANKETLVVAGDLITGLALEHRTPILPVDSEHSAIFQCLNGESHNRIDKILLTASGGPFRNLSKEQLQKVTVQQALHHPNWNMGAKVTIDSSTLMNKGFEMIEAKWLFAVQPSRIEVVVHPQSIIHSMVQFEDGSVMAQLGHPDMRIPIQYAFSYPQRLALNVPKVNLFEIGAFTFEKPDTDKFRNLAFAYQCVERGGNACCVLNAANEVAVASFLREEIGYWEMSDVIARTLSDVAYVAHPDLQTYLDTDAEARKVASSFIKETY